MRALSYRRNRSKARTAARKGDWPTAVRLYEASLSGGKGSSRDFIQLGHACKEARRKEKVASCYRQAIALDWLEPDGYRQLGHFLIQTDQGDDAEIMFSTVLLLQPADLDARRFLAERGLTEERLEAVLAAAGERLTEGMPSPDPTSQLTRLTAKINLGLARSAARRRNWDLAAWRYHRLLRDLPAQPRLLVQYGHALKALRRWDEAEGAYRKAAVMAPNDVDAVIQLGHILKLKGLWPAARHALQRALELDPNCDVAAEEIGRIEVLEHEARMAMPLFPEPADLVAAPSSLPADAAQILFRYQYLTPA